MGGLHKKIILVAEARAVCDIERPGFTLSPIKAVAHGNDWAHGFMRGTLVRHGGWLELVNDEEQGGCMVPILMLHYEHDTDPKMRPNPSALSSGKM